MQKVLMWAVGLALLASATVSQAQEQNMLDRVAVIVNEDVVLESEIEMLKNRIRRQMEAEGQTPPSDSALRTQVTERLVAQTLQMQLAERMGVRVSDSHLDQSISGIAADQGIPLEAMRQQIEADGGNWQQYREDIRRQITTQEVQRASLQQRIYISPQEIRSVVRRIQEQEADGTEYRLRQILIGMQNEEGEQDEAGARDRAERVMEMLEEGEDFAQLAVTASSAANALEGGDMGWLGLNEMPTLFAEEVEDAGAGSLHGPIRTGVGFHILLVEDIRGAEMVTAQEVRARHILIQPSVVLSERRAEEMLYEFKDELEAGEADFAELAREHSADTGSASRGGDLGWSSPDRYVPNFRDTVNRLEPGEMSDPFQTEHGWHLVEVTDKREMDVTEERMEQQAQQILYNRKFSEELDIWLQEIRDNAYVEYRD